MSEPDHFESFVILGQTAAGKRFRPSDWAERLCGVMSPYCPPGRRSGPLAYSPYVVPGNRDGIKCVTVDGRLYGIEPMAYRFMLNFASENNLQVEMGEAAAAPDEAEQGVNPIGNATPAQANE